MADAFGAAAAAAGLLEQAIKMFTRIREAKQRQADLPAIINEYMGVVKTSKDIVEFVRREPSLVSHNVMNSTQGIKDAALELTNHLSTMHDHLDSGTIRGFAHQLFSGSDDQRQLKAIVDKLTRQKMDLTVNIGLANVGLVKGYGNAISVNTIAVEELSVRVKALLGEDGGLRIAKVIEGRPKNENGTIPLTSEDIAKLANVSGDTLKYTEAEVPGSTRKIRRIENNIALKGALQVNAPVGQDIWAHMDVIVVENNIADVDAAQYCYPISSSDFLASLKIMKSSK
ncbi:hypothetical protein E0Z10_g4752 [Xylaria hypoxylon]|uniref:NACHT-NTPase and P-loop NTPases N-terminal domain-containing protein n=1 Tax=Xylaria hypoxylon TaxID=37992 RepID=A0A4Z0YZJ7_9PEZI|nr:hypothetical protein E0Z10_g4752 [Xylaria hypoxylon]